MTRREILKYTALVTGTAVSGTFASAFLSGCSTPKVEEASFQPLFFTAEEHLFVQTFLDFLLPKTDSPSATEVGVDQTLDSMLANVYGKERQEQAREGLTGLRDFFNKQGDMSAAFQACENSSEVQKDVTDAFKSLKQQGISFYLATETVAKNHLNYLPVPGEYKACISMEEAGNKMWAL